MIYIRKPGLIVTIVLSIFSLSGASYEPMVVLKFPFMSEHPDSIGEIQDSLVRYRDFQATL